MARIGSATGALLIVLVASVAHGTAEISRSTVAGGAGTSSGISITVRYTAGQSVTGKATSASYIVGAGFWTPDSSSLVSVLDGGPLGIPRFHDLYQNKPNPFNPQTTIRYDLPADAALVRLRVFDVGGRLVTTLLDGPATAGRKHVVWGGFDDRGRPVASGTYYYVLEAPRYVSRKKMTLLR